MKQRFEQRAAYEKELKDILSEDQYKTYQQMRPYHGMRGHHQGENCAQQQCAGDQQHCNSHVQQKDGEHCQQATSNCCQSDSKVADKTTEKTDK